MKHRTIKSLALALAALMILSMLAVLPASAEAEKIPAANVYSGEPDDSWFDKDNLPTDKTFVITTADQLAALYDICKDSTLSTAVNGFVGYTVKLGADIVWQEGNAADWKDPANAPEEMWSPIEDFFGTFDGDGHLISGLYTCMPQKGEVGFFGCIGKSGTTITVKNLGIVNSYFQGRNNTGAVIADVDYGGALIENVFVDAIVEGATHTMGGFIGMLYGCGKSDPVLPITIKNSVFAGSVEAINKTDTDMGQTVGGLIGNIHSGGNTEFIVIENCVVSGSIIAARKIAGVAVAVNANGCTPTISIKNFVNFATITDPTDPIVGLLAGKNTGTIKYDNIIASTDGPTVAADATNSTGTAEVVSGGTGITTKAPAEMTGVLIDGWTVVSKLGFAVPASVATICAKDYPVVDHSPVQPGGEGGDGDTTTEGTQTTTQKPEGNTTEKPADNNNTTAAPKAEEKGCASTVVGFGAILALCTLGTGAVVIRKKED